MPANLTFFYIKYGVRWNFHNRYFFKQTTMLKKMPVPIITGVPLNVKMLSNDKIVEENGSADDSSESEEQVKDQAGKIGSSLDCLEQNTVPNLIDIDKEYDDVTLEQSVNATSEVPATPSTQSQASDVNPQAFVQSPEGILNDRDGNALVTTTLRAVETMPCTSYSSSDDDDDDDDESEFFDANEYTGDIETQLEHKKRLVAP